MQLFDFLGSFCYHGITNLQIDIPQFTNVNGQKEEYFEGRNCKRMERRCIDNEISAAKVIQVRFITLVDGQTEFYFGSVAAIYTVFTRDDLGIKESTLRNSKFPKRTNRCVISKFTSCGTSLPIMGEGGRWLDRMLLLGGSYVHITFTQSAYVWLT
ncbi:MAG: hypothetical protein MJZ60_07655 [Bacteroidaceae bacterium]|nr:hypothetical protein [Bacteroidaceae bacterium]